MMKKIFSLLAFALVCVMFVSCDNNTAQRLDGVWEGEVAQTFFVGRWGKPVTEFQSVDIEFFKDPYRFAKGTGVEIDYTYVNEKTGRVSYVKCDFVYEVRNGRIYLDYADGSHIVIYRYSLGNSRFSGVFCDYRTGEELASFNFYRVNNHRYLNDRNYYYSNDYSGGYYYGNAAAPEVKITYEEIPSPMLEK
ncbi:MAG: hypothetical protein KBT34_11765 [Prevotella sp.]|nr:hypothetical protein [Candidatus Prevotella equi]